MNSTEDEGEERGGKAASRGELQGQVIDGASWTGKGGNKGLAIVVSLPQLTVPIEPQSKMCWCGGGRG